MPPNSITCSTFLSQSACVSWIEKSASPMRFLIHFTPWSCGSINKGHLSQDVTTAAFSMETRSAGNDSFFHLAISASDTRTFRGSTPSVWGILRSTMSLFQLCFQRSVRKAAENGEIYPTKDDARRQSPTNVNPCFCSPSTAEFHRSFSFPNPPTSRSAIDSFRLQFSASCSVLYRSFFALCSLASKASTLSCTSRASSTTIFNFASAACFAAVASFAFAISGATRLNILLYSAIFTTQLHRCAAACDFFVIAAKLK
mmetsp:Transcript_83826/g.191346  ORF Transcript_83826/g.191346 Transcript_83826/m.191346 type:complete len:257 (-) Transcript_83826:910-1680(-)